MRRDHLLVWDDFVSVTSTIYQSSALLDEKLGRFDQLALFCGLTDVSAPTSGTSTLWVWIAHSGNGETFLYKTASGGIPPTNPEITFTWTTAPAAALVQWGSDPNALANPSTPFLKYVRIYIAMTNVSKPVRARVYVTQRDQGG